jgi:diguanylate cyclase (GGDEF)-like protein
VADDLSPRARTEQRAAIQIAVLRLTRALLGRAGVKSIGECAVDAVARMLRARIASLAVRRTSEELEIVAATGYPLALVEHLRIPGAPGVLKTVFESGKPLRVDDVARVPGVTRKRPRYATGSCIAWPLLVGADLVGILCASDRLDHRPFSRADVSVMRSLAAPIALAVSRELTRNQAEALAHAAAVDPLSGLFNRRYFHQRLAEELERAQRYGMPVALAMVDLDNFKTVNDRHGHLAGDAIIHQTADLMRRSVRVFDICTRFGGDEFAIVMPGSTLDAAMRIAERIRERVAAESFGDGLQLQVTASIGVAVADTGVGTSDLIAQADHALYVAKQRGKNRVIA